MSRKLIPGPFDGIPFPSELEDASYAARCWAGLAVTTLAEIAADRASPAMARVIAATKILDRGYGTVEPVSVTGKKVDIYGLTDLELEKVMRSTMPPDVPPAALLPLPPPEDIQMPSDPPSDGFL